ncbi:MAG TPA: hypothetical protein VHQ87_08885 [Rhizobacter sp.]|jgi:hypothetical protein|nr:hypothetical protein [Rhizobacter sp.]
MNLRLACVLLALCGLAHADDAAERVLIKQKREAVEAEYLQRQAVCRKQFVVTSCLDKARAHRLEGLKVLRAQEADLDDAQRRQRAEAQAQRIDEKAKAAELREAPKPSKEPNPPKEPRVVTPKAAKPPAAKASAADRSAEEQRKREAFEARQREIQAHKEEVEKRNAERASHKPPTPLPVPASAP